MSGAFSQSKINKAPNTALLSFQENTKSIADSREGDRGVFHVSKCEGLSSGLSWQQEHISSLEGRDLGDNIPGSVATL